MHSLVGKVLAAIVVCIGPALTMRAYFTLAHGPGRQDSWALAISLAVGLLALNTFRFPGGWRIFASLLYLGGMGMLLVVYSFAYVCSTFRSCL